MSYWCITCQLQAATLQEKTNTERKYCCLECQEDFYKARSFDDMMLLSGNKKDKKDKRNKDKTVGAGKIKKTKDTKKEKKDKEKKRKIDEDDVANQRFQRLLKQKREEYTELRRKFTNERTNYRNNINAGNVGVAEMHAKEALKIRTKIITILAEAEGNAMYDKRDDDVDNLRKIRNKFENETNSFDKWLVVKKVEKKPNTSPRQEDIIDENTSFERPFIIDKIEEVTENDYYVEELIDEIRRSRNYGFEYEPYDVSQPFDDSYKDMSIKTVLFFSDGSYTTFNLLPKTLKSLLKPSDYSVNSINSSSGILCYKDDDYGNSGNQSNVWLGFLQSHNVALPRNITAYHHYLCVGFNKTTNTIIDIPMDFVTSALNWRKDKTIKIATLFHNYNDYFSSETDDNLLDFEMIMKEAVVGKKKVVDTRRQDVVFIKHKKIDLDYDLNLPKLPEYSYANSYKMSVDKLIQTNWISEVLSKPYEIDVVSVDKNSKFISMPKETVDALVSDLNDWYSPKKFIAFKFFKLEDDYYSYYESTGDESDS